MQRTYWFALFSFVSLITRHRYIDWLYVLTCIVFASSEAVQCIMKTVLRKCSLKGIRNLHHFLAPVLYAITASLVNEERDLPDCAKCEHATHTVCAKMILDHTIRTHRSLCANYVEFMWNLWAKSKVGVPSRHFARRMLGNSWPRVRSRSGSHGDGEKSVTRGWSTGPCPAS